MFFTFYLRPSYLVL